MKLLDEVKVLTEDYKNSGIRKGMIGTIIDADIRWDSFYVCFQDQRIYDKEFMMKGENVIKLNNDICLGIKIKDLAFIKDGGATDELIMESLPEKHKDWWCKVEEGFIVNLKGERKNKVPYNYDS